MAKKIFWAFNLIIIPFIFSCSRGDDFRLTTQQQININIDIISRIEASDTTRISILDTNVQYLDYFVFDKENGTLYSHKKIEREPLHDQNFESIIDVLPCGKYYISILASSDMALHIEGNQYGSTQLFMASNQNEIYYSTFEISVGNKTLTTNTSLSRIVGRIEVIVNDALSAPELICDIQTYMRNSVPAMYDFKSQHVLNVPNGGIGNDKSYIPIGAKLTRSELININSKNPISFYMLPTTDWEGLDNDLYISITAENGTQQVKLIRSALPIAKNTITRLDGELFNKASDTTNDIQHYWSTTTNIPF